MKKFLTGIAAFAIGSSLFAQVMSEAGVENNLWTGFGKGVIGDPKFYGVENCLQARVDINSFTIEGMVNWGAVAYYDGNDDLDFFVFENNEGNALRFHYAGEGGDDEGRAGSDTDFFKASLATGKTYDNRILLSAVRQDPYYVNFLWHPLQNFDFGMGTKLNWQVGPAPRFGSWLWEADAHVRQGGFSTSFDDRDGSRGNMYTPDRPGTADVVGFVHYANKYAKKAIGARFFYDSKDSFNLQIGAAIPNGATTDNPVCNVGFYIGFDKFSVSAAFEGLFQQYGNFYTGVTVGAEEFNLEAWFAADNLKTSKDDYKARESAFGTGAAVTFWFKKAGITLRPEGGINWFEDSDWTPAWYVGANFAWNIADRMVLSAWGSWAVGSMDKDWKDYKETEDWDGGHVLNIRPEFSLLINKNHSISAYLNLEQRTAFDGKSRDCWSTGAYWTYKLATTKAKATKKR